MHSLAQTTDTMHVMKEGTAHETIGCAEHQCKAADGSMTPQRWERARPPRGWTALQRGRRLLNFDPRAAAPMAVTFVLAPPIAFGAEPPPIVGVDVEPRFRFVLDPTAHVPAVTFVIADDRG
jgi:hypothetical protein